MIAYDDLAAAAGLRHLPDDRPGIRRVKRGRGFSYVDADGTVVDASERERIVALAIPPAWTDVWIAPEHDAHLLVTGRDDRGRKQSLYHPDWRGAADLAKFDRLAVLGGRLASLRRQVDDDLRRRTPLWPVAAVVRLIDDSLIRPGSMRNLADNGSVGATTLSPEHIAVDGRRIVLDFEGKSAVEQHVEVVDPLLARRVSALIDDDTNPGGLFVDADGRAVDPAAVNTYIAEHVDVDVSARLLRTWGATCAVAEFLLTGSADTDKEPAELVRAAIEHAADRLGNTAAVCRSSYVAPSVVSSFESGELADAWVRSRRAKWLSRTEQTVRKVLQA